MRPKSVRRFELFYLGSIAVAVVNLALSYGQVGSSLSSLAGTAESLPGVGTTIASLFAVSAMMGLLFALIIPMTLWYLAARRGSQTARWLIVALGVLSAIHLLFLILIVGFATSAGLAGWMWYGMMLGVVSETLHMIAIYFLFPQDAREWFDRGRSPARTQDIFS